MQPEAAPLPKPGWPDGAAQELVALYHAQASILIGLDHLANRLDALRFPLSVEEYENLQPGDEVPTPLPLTEAQKAELGEIVILATNFVEQDARDLAKAAGRVAETARALHLWDLNKGSGATSHHAQLRAWYSARVERYS